jgi:Rac GTPase-activating protein 1
MAKTYLKLENCSHCQKKIKFGSVGLKCRECRVCVHPDCKDKYTIGCVPQSATKSPNNLGFINEYTPSVGPMIPPLIVHCVNEIETRGLKEVGIFRVSGSEREVKMLKEKFLKQKGVPFLNNIDIHVLCGCVKDFLRSLREPLIPRALWMTFSNAVQITDTERQKKEVYRAIQQMPQANRDTLAFLIMHLQRIAECPETKMPLMNLAKVFAPTIVGYSCANPDSFQLFGETPVQFNVRF